MNPVLIVMCLTLSATSFYQAMKAKPEVWLGDKTNACIAIVMPDKSELPCPEDKSELPYPHIPVYVIEETE